MWHAGPVTSTGGTERVRGATAPPTYAAAPLSPARHVWLTSGADDDVRARPALLVEWRRVAGVARGAPSTWEGRVVSLACVRTGRWALVEEWVPAALLTPR